ncbi:glycerol-3-phosphate dehydrogenase [Vibrio sp. SCSIO 43136]|uniref:glycerol-3-phosphate dehydrogenase n=1 Tax=Vibrio sp. SCSIO 43136 TaxID=2819101 RepID=UPI0020761ADB|nr:glycerol-3-phosphate dehydrogenase [Vibrio sp. SCSIO 43136]
MEHQFEHDLVVIGGGINGVAIAADAAGRGLNVALFEMSDLASATSSASSKLIHGGLRYLEHYEFRLVSEALAEREVLLKNAPHLVSPLRFRLPHRPHLRPAWMIRTGLFMYDHLGKRVSLAGSHNVRFTSQDPLKPEMKKGFEYSDCYVDDARLVVTNAVSAKQNGAKIHTQTKCIDAKPRNNGWVVTLQKPDGQTFTVTTKVLVNAAGPWVASLYQNQIHQASPNQIRLVKGSHIVVPKIHDQPQAYILQNEDQRIVFVIPYQKDFSLVGTTDVDYKGDPAKVEIDNDEIEYLCEVVNQHFTNPITPQDVVTTWSGVRPLLADESDSAQEVTRDYTMEREQIDGAEIVSIFGGKITTYRKLGQAAVNKIADLFPQMGLDWTADTPLPGGDIESREALQAKLKSRYVWMEDELIERWVNYYGSRTHQLLEGVNDENDLGEHFGHGLYQSEVDFLIDNEWVVFSEDLLWRRGKLGLRFSQDQIARLDQYLASRMDTVSKHGIDEKIA